MNPLEAFMTYASAFEKTYGDDDWTRLTEFFTEDAIYRIESDRYGCELQGPQAILAGMKKSLDGLDRRFSGREIDITEGPAVSGNELRATWKVTYTRDGWSPFVLPGRTHAVLDEQGRIERLVDTFEDRMSAELDAWMRENDAAVDPSYT